MWGQTRRELQRVINHADDYGVRVIYDEGLIQFLGHDDRPIWVADDLDEARRFLGLCDAHPGTVTRRVKGQDKAFFEGLFAKVTL